MGQKIISYNSTTGQITGIYDSTDSTVPVGVTSTLNITDVQYQDILSTPGYTVVSGALTAPAATVKQMQWLKAEGGQLVHEDGTPYRLKGINWYGFESRMFPGMLSNRAYKTVTVSGVVNVGILDQLASLGFNAIRLPICEDITSTSALTATFDSISIALNPDLIDDANVTLNQTQANGTGTIAPILILDKIIAYAKSLGIRIILDMHSAAPLSSTAGPNTGFNGYWYTTAAPGDTGGTSIGTPGDLRSEAQLINAWTFLANRYKNEPAVCGFDLVNEPYSCTWDTNATTGIVGAYERCAAAIQAINPNVMILCEGVQDKSSSYPSGWNSWGVLAQGLHGVKTTPVQITYQDKLAYSTHEYINSTYQWAKSANFPNTMIEVWDTMWGYIIKDGIAPVIIGEYGGNFETGSTLDLAFISKLEEYAKELNVSALLFAVNSSTSASAVEGLLNSTDNISTNAGTLAVTTAMNSFGPNNDSGVGDGTYSCVVPVVTSQYSGIVAAGATGTTQNFGINNVGSKTLNITSITTTGDYLYTGSATPVTVAPGAQVQLTYTFNPVGGIGTENGTMVIVSDSISSPDIVSMTGVGVNPPTASFTATPVTGAHPLTVQFTDTSTYNITGWSWTFGDGGTSTVQNPSYSYAAAGTYTVTLTATNVAGSNTATQTNMITVS